MIVGCVATERNVVIVRRWSGRKGKVNGDVSRLQGRQGRLEFGPEGLGGSLSSLEQIIDCVSDSEQRITRTHV